MSLIPRLPSLFCIGFALLLDGGRAAEASPCCAGNSAVPSLISGDEKAQIGFFWSHSEVIGDALAEGLPEFRTDGNDEVLNTWRLQGAWLLSDRWQASASVPLVQHRWSHVGAPVSSSGLGDMRLSVGYEALPQWSYSIWKPRGYVYLQLTVPTGRSVHEIRDSGGLALGNGNANLSLGTLFLKRWTRWDAFFAPEVHRGFMRRFGELEVRPGWGGSVAFGGGYSPARSGLRIGLRFQPAFAEAKKITAGSAPQTTSGMRVCDTSVDLTYLLQEDWSVQLSHLDQTLLGPAKGTTLSRGAAFGMQYRWLR